MLDNKNVSNGGLTWPTIGHTKGHAKRHNKCITKGTTKGKEKEQRWVHQRAHQRANQRAHQRAHRRAYTNYIFLLSYKVNCPAEIKKTFLVSYQLNLVCFLLVFIKFLGCQTGFSHCISYPTISILSARVMFTHRPVTLLCSLSSIPYSIQQISLINFNPQGS